MSGDPGPRLRRRHRHLDRASAPPRRSTSPENGFHVFAGVRRAEDGEALRAQAPERLTPVIIDVTDEATISAAAATVADAVGDRGLAGLVNNAGIAKPAPIELQPMADFRTQLEVNLFGPVAMVQAFLPLIRQGGGRIVNVGSIGGLLVLPLNGAYSASKFGIRAVSDALRLELRQWNIHVSLIEVAPVKTAIFGKTYAELDGARAEARRDGLPAVRGADRRGPEGDREGGGGRGSAAGDRESHRATRSRRTSPRPGTWPATAGRQVAVAAALPDRARDRRSPASSGFPKPE